jgi:hypothetical protein
VNAYKVDKDEYVHFPCHASHLSLNREIAVDDEVFKGELHWERNGDP